MNRPWIPEEVVDPDLARELVEERFPDFSPARIEPLGVGWDNTAYLVNGTWVFRFPRRTLSVELMRAEIAVLPAIAERLPLAVPVPALVGAADDRFPWPYAGYRHLSGRLAHRARLDDGARTRAAVPLARFLRALHSIPLETVPGARPDALGRLDVAKRIRQAEASLAHSRELGLLDDLRPYERILAEAPTDWRPTHDTLSHGDFDARHVLVDDDGLPCGVIDWGDVHLGDPAEDLRVAQSFLPPAARPAFFEVYGEVDGDRLRVSALRALQVWATVLRYGHDIGDDDLVREARVALSNLAA